MSARLHQPAPTPAASISAHGGLVLRRCAACGGGGGGLDGMCEECRKKQLQRSAVSSAASPAIPPSVDNVLNSPGHVLDSETRGLMESRFGHDFSRVRIHTDFQAADSARDVNALAYTVGHDIAFAAGRFAPGTPSGRQLIAHELTHVVQQSGSSNFASPRSEAQDETEARISAESFLHDDTAIPDIGLSAPVLRRQAPGGGAAPTGGTGGTPAPTGGTPAPANGGLSDEMLRQIARRLRAAMAGPGTDEEAIYSALSGRSREQVDAIARVYQQEFSRNLRADLEDELTRSELLRLALFSPADAPEAGQPAPASDTPDARAVPIARQLNAAMDRLGTDEESIYAALTGRTPDEITAIKNAYRSLVQRELEADLRDEMSGSELTRALRLLGQGVLQPADEIYLAMEGLGTDEATIFRVLEGMAGNNTAITALEQDYRAKYGDLIADLRGDLSGDEYSRAMRVLGPVIQDVAFEDCGATVLPQVRAIIPTGVQKVERAITVLSQGWNNMSVAEKAVFNRFYDPSNTGDIDQRFVSEVLANFRAIRRQFDNNLVAECESTGGLCSGTRLYYTYGSNVHVCPYFTTETDVTRKARDFVHELAHNAMEAFDRPYYSPTSTAYAALTPRGPTGVGIPVIGPIIRAIARSDTLYHPDAYSWFAFTV